MARFSEPTLAVASEIIARYPRTKSALIPLLHLAQEQDGYVADDAMEHIAELLGITPAEVLGTCSFYEMFKREPVGRYLVNICTNISCQIMGGEELLAHAQDQLGVNSGGTTPDGMFTVIEFECLGACDRAPVVMVNNEHWQEFQQPEDVPALIEGLRTRGVAALTGCHLVKEPTNS